MSSTCRYVWGSSMPGDGGFASAHNSNVVPPQLRQRGSFASGDGDVPASTVGVGQNEGVVIVMKSSIVFTGLAVAALAAGSSAAVSAGGGGGRHHHDEKVADP